MSMEGHGSIPIKFYLRTLEFCVIFMCHTTFSFFIFSTTEKVKYHSGLMGHTKMGYRLCWSTGHSLPAADQKPASAKLCRPFFKVKPMGDTVKWNCSGGRGCGVERVWEVGVGWAHLGDHASGNGSRAPSSYRHTHRCGAGKASLRGSCWGALTIRALAQTWAPQPPCCRSSLALNHSLLTVPSPFSAFESSFSDRCGYAGRCDLGSF